MICITISLISQLVLFCEHPFFHLLCFLPFLHDVALSRYLVMLGCVFIFVLVSTVTFLGMLYLFAQTLGYGPGHTTDVYIEVWGELQWRKGGSVLDVELAYSPWALAASQVIISLLFALCVHTPYGCMSITVVYCLDKDVKVRRDAI